jgi:hypothetical protein
MKPDTSRGGKTMRFLFIYHGGEVPEDEETQNV